MGCLKKGPPIAGIIVRCPRQTSLLENVAVTLPLARASGFVRRCRFAEDRGTCGALICFESDSTLTNDGG